MLKLRIELLLELAELRDRQAHKVDCGSGSPPCGQFLPGGFIAGLGKSTHPFGRPCRLRKPLRGSSCTVVRTMTMRVWC